MERVQKAGGLYANFASDQSLGYLNGTLPGGTLVDIQRDDTYFVMTKYLEIHVAFLYICMCSRVLLRETENM